MMIKRNTNESPLVESRFLWAFCAVVLVVVVLTVRLWHIQVYKGEHYSKISENNRIRKIEIPASRGIIYDRNGKIVLGNRPFFDLTYLTQYGRDRESTFKALSQLLDYPVQFLDRMMRASRGRPKYLPMTLKRNLSLHEVSIIESNRIFLPGVEINVAPRRNYTKFTPSHIVGYLGEITSAELQKYAAEDLKSSYVQGDLVGKQGLEKRWEPYLRGRRGYRLIQVDAFGRRSSVLDQQQWDLPAEPAIQGSDLNLTIDIDLQNAVTKAFQGKNGAVVVLSARTGEILAMVSSPDYDPSMYQESLSVEKWQSQIRDPYKPLFDKTTGGEFAPGSIYKPVVAIAALEEGTINENTRHHCKGSFELGGNTFHCHNRYGHGSVNVRQAMMKSCDVFFYTIGVEMGVDAIGKYARALGLGRRLGVRLNKERAGLIPTSAWKKLTYRFPWTVGDTPPISIGQGANLITPIQMANLYATLGNGGTVRRPIVVKSITNHVGENIYDGPREIINEVSLIRKSTFRRMARILQSVVMDEQGTGKKAAVEGVTVAGKTGSVQVVSLKKNRNQKDVSMKWREHAMFAAFSPTVDPEISVAVISENDRVGGGGTAAAPVAGEIITAYWKIKKKRRLASAAYDRNKKAQGGDTH